MTQSLLPSQIIAAVEQAREMVNPVLAGWVRGHLASGRTPYEIIQMLVADGKPVEISTLLVGLAIKGLAVTHASRLPPGSGLANPGDPAHADTHTVELEGFTARTLLSMGKAGMELVLYENLLSDSEMGHLKTAAAPGLKSSMVQGANFVNASSDARTSHDAYLGRGCDEVVSSIERRISALVGIPVDRGENIQVLHYGPSHEYKPHFDFFDPGNQREHAIMAAAGNRVGTMIMYLGDVERGGATYFPHLDLAVHPRRGQALWFRYLRDGLLDERSQHAGMPVVAGEKWIATKWFRERRLSGIP